MIKVQVPDLLAYQKPIIVSSEPSLFDRLYVYVIEKYDYQNGINVYIGFRKNNLLIRMADFDANMINLKDNGNQQIHDILNITEDLAKVMKLIRVNDASFYFPAGNLMLIDMMISVNKFASPGMLRDLFGKILPIQNILAIETLDEKIVSEYKGNIVKPSRYRHVVYKEAGMPLYGILE